MNTHEKKCSVCGWWDITMKYGAASRCTHCGAPLIQAIARKANAEGGAPETGKSVARANA